MLYSFLKVYLEYCSVKGYFLPLVVAAQILTHKKNIFANVNVLISYSSSWTITLWTFLSFTFSFSFTRYQNL